MLVRSRSSVTWASAPPQGAAKQLQKKSSLKTGRSTRVEGKRSVVFAPMHAHSEFFPEETMSLTRERFGKERRGLDVVGVAPSPRPTLGSLGKSSSLESSRRHGVRGVADLLGRPPKKFSSLSDLSTHPKEEPDWYKVDLDFDLFPVADSSLKVASKQQEATPTLTSPPTLDSPPAPEYLPVSDSKPKRPLPRLNLKLNDIDFGEELTPRPLTPQVEVEPPSKPTNQILLSPILSSTEDVSAEGAEVNELTPRPLTPLVEVKPPSKLTNQILLSPILSSTEDMSTEGAEGNAAGDGVGPSLCHAPSPFPVFIDDPADNKSSEDCHAHCLCHMTGRSRGVAQPSLLPLLSPLSMASPITPLSASSVHTPSETREDQGEESQGAKFSHFGLDVDTPPYPPKEGVAGAGGEKAEFPMVSPYAVSVIGAKTQDWEAGKAGSLVPVPPPPLATRYDTLLEKTKESKASTQRNNILLSQEQVLKHAHYDIPTSARVKYFRFPLSDSECRIFDTNRKPSFRSSLSDILMHDSSDGAGGALSSSQSEIWPSGQRSHYNVPYSCASHRRLLSSQEETFLSLLQFAGI